MNRPIITLLTDFGLTDHYVAAMKGVILSICPEARLVDISHDIAPFSVPESAFTLAQAWRYFPKGTIHLAVVDPGVGSERRGIIAEVAGHRFVAPDNGLLTLILDSNPKAKMREISSSRYFRHPVSSTFHGRDVFAPVAAYLAKGLLPARLGTLVSDPILGNFAKPTRLSLSRWVGSVLRIDRFGNVITNLEWDTFATIAIAPFILKLGGRAVTRFYPTYSAAPAGQIFALNGSSGYVEISLKESAAAAKLGVLSGSRIDLDLGPA